MKAALAFCRWAILSLRHRRAHIRLDFGCDVDFSSVLEGWNRIHARSRIRRSWIGRGTFVAPDTELNDVRIGRFSSIGNGVKQVIGTHPAQEWATTHPAFFSPRGQAGFTFVEESRFGEEKLAEAPFRIVVGSDVWIGAYTMICDGVRIGDGAIVGAGSLVLRDVPSFEIWGGVPARKIRDRFPPGVVQNIQSLSWWNFDPKWLKKHAASFKDAQLFIENVHVE